MRLTRPAHTAVLTAAGTLAAAVIMVAPTGAAHAAGGVGCIGNSRLNKGSVGTGTQPQPGQTATTAPVGSTGDSGPACYFNPDPQNLKGLKGHPVKCQTADGYWSNTYNCYISAMKPPPAASDPAWNGHQPGDGAVYNCYQPQTGMAIEVWAANPPAGPGQTITPEQVAQLAIKHLKMLPVSIGMAPFVEPDGKRHGNIGVPVWLWAKQGTPSTYSSSDKPLTATASAGGITVTAKAYVERVEWTMGDGSDPIECGAGTPIDTHEPDHALNPKTDASPDCGYIYDKTSWDQPNHAYTVTARSFWRVDWSGAGQQGTIRLPGLVSKTTVNVGELQVLTTQG